MITGKEIGQCVRVLASAACFVTDHEVSGSVFLLLLVFA